MHVHLGTQKRVSSHRRGIVLVLVLFLTILLAASVSAFVRRSTIDAMIVQNRNQAAQAEALARGGVRLAETLLLEDLLEDQNQQQETGIETQRDVWARASQTHFEMEDGGILALDIRDAASRINLNGFFKEELPHTPSGELAVRFLTTFFEQVIEDMPGKPEEKLYDVEMLVGNLVDYIDKNDTREKDGSPENDLYAKLDPPYHSANRPLMSVDELRKIDGFDERLVLALEPYVTVYPYAPRRSAHGINPNTAPEWVLRMLYYRDGISEYRLADEDIVRAISRARAKGVRFCPTASEECTTLGDVHPSLDSNIYPTPSYDSSVFIVRAEAKVGEITKTIEAVIDRAEPTELLLLSWRVL